MRIAEKMEGMEKNRGKGKDVFETKQKKIRKEGIINISSKLFLMKFKAAAQ